MLNKLLLRDKSKIVERWLGLIFDSYGEDASEFFQKKGNGFANPVGSIISTNAELIFSELINRNDKEHLFIFLQDVVKIRAIQKLTPSEAVNFIHLLKKAIKLEVIDKRSNSISLDDYLDLQESIDQLALLTFDIYQEAREDINRIRINELKKYAAAINRQHGGSV